MADEPYSAAHRRVDGGSAAAPEVPRARDEQVRRSKAQAEEVSRRVTGIAQQIADVAEQAKASVFGGDTVKVNRNELLTLVDRLRAALPDQLSRADEIVAQANEALEDANAQAESIIAAARDRAEELVGEQTVTAQAQARARELVDEGRRQAQQLAAEADAYCDSRLAQLEETLDRLRDEAAGGRRVLHDRQQDRAQ